MRIDDKLKKPIKEARYLDVENTDRYRTIIRLFYLNYEKLKYWMYQEEVYEELQEDPYFSEYTVEQCQQDLESLKNWGNLATIQDTRKAKSLQEFQKKKFRYQLSETAVEIERMVIRLEGLSIEGSSLEPSLLERIRESFHKIEEIYGETPEKIYAWWKDLESDFVRLNQNYQDYMRELNSVKAEEMMQTKEFLLFKDRLIEYLRSFVKSLQINVTLIEQYLTSISEEKMNVILQTASEYEFQIPRLDSDVEIRIEDLYERMTGRWNNIRQWFIGGNGTSSEALKVFDMSNEIIRKITRYATRISEQSNHGANRREEYRKLSSLFCECENIGQAHMLSSLVFGMEKPFHLRGYFPRKTDSISSGIYEEEAAKMQLRPRIRSFHEKISRSAISDHTKEKEEIRTKMIARMEEEKRILESYIFNNRLDFASLPLLTPEIRDVFLLWLSKGLENKDRRSKTEDGREYQVILEEEKAICTLECSDGQFIMPAYSIIFEEIED